MVRGFGCAIVALAAFAGPAFAQVVPNPEIRGALRAPSLDDATSARVFGLDVSAAANDRVVQFGFDRRFGGWSMGLKGDWSSNQSCARLDAFDPIGNCSGFNWQGTASGRVAYAWNSLTAFTQGGAVFSQWDRAALSDTRSGFDAAKSISTGWVLGGGLEYAVGGTWSLRAEYNYFDYGRPEPGSAPAVSNLNDSYDIRSHMLMFGLKRRM
jgi:opacity protein-like surface antigen